MKKCWKIRNNADIKICLYKLNVDKNYINILLEDDSEPMRYLNQNPKPDFIYISYDYDDYSTYHNNNWGWFEEKHFNSKWLKEYKFCGEINFRKEKLKKIKNES